MRIVLDTSVLVAALRSREGASFVLVSQLPSKAFEIALSVPLYTEWQAVLSRAEHLPPRTSADDVLRFLRYLASIAHLQEIHFLWRPVLRDANDDMVLECAVASQSRYIVTHNVRDFDKANQFGIEAIVPGMFLTRLKEGVA